MADDKALSMNKNEINKKIFVLVILFSLSTLGLLAAPVLGLEVLQQRTIILLVISIILWTTRVIPTGISALLIIALQMTLGIAPQFSDAVQGFASSTIYFLLAASLVSSAMTKVHLDKFLSKVLMKASRGSVQKTLWGFFLANLALPIIMPSGNVRLRMFIPLIEEVNQRFHLGTNSPFLRFSIWMIGGLNQIGTIIVFTGGGLGILAAGLLIELGYPLTWIQWFLMMAPPIWIICTITAFFMWRYLKAYKIENKQLKAAEESSLGIDTAIKFPFMVVIAGLFLMLFLWMVGPLWNIPSIIPPLICLALFAMPGIELLDNHDLRNYDWENFLLLGSAISLAITIQQNGTASIIANSIFSILGQSSYEGFNFFILVIVVFLLRAMFVSPVGALTVIFPLAIAFAETVGLNNLFTFLTITILVASFIILPIHSPIMILAYETGYIVFKEHLVISLVLLITSIVIVFFCYEWYWPLFQ
ncbi:SLC13 family permease [Neobacillus niacini]|uniref:SLC13 family permease n=1 Tax=Neobacillus niacini TaxID=86668 RepID=UPI003983C662